MAPFPSFRLSDFEGDVDRQAAGAGRSSREKHNASGDIEAIVDVEEPRALVEEIAHVQNSIIGIYFDSGNGPYGAE
jgi:hypothetical protein